MLPRTVPPEPSDHAAALATLCAAHGVAILYVLRRAGDLAPWERERQRLVLAAMAAKR